MSALDDLLAGEDEVPRTKAALDTDVLELGREQRLAMAARRTADLFDHCSMYATAGLLRELARAADFELNASLQFFDE
jgi:hypothetical protein